MFYNRYLLTVALLFFIIAIKQRVVCSQVPDTIKIEEIVDNQSNKYDFQKDKFVFFSSGSLESAFRKDMTVGVGSIGVFVRFGDWKVSALVSIGTGKDSVFQDHARTMIRPGMRTGMGIDLRYIINEKRVFEKCILETGLNGYYRVSVNDIWAINSLDMNGAKKTTAEYANVSAFSLGGYVRLITQTKDMKVVSVSADIMPITTRFLNNNIVFDEEKQKNLRLQTMNQKDRWFYGGILFYSNAGWSWQPVLDFLFTIQYDDISVFYQGLLLQGGVMGLTGGQGVVGVQYNVNLF